MAKDMFLLDYEHTVRFFDSCLILTRGLAPAYTRQNRASGGTEHIVYA
jgi:hypothetical protein